jgi:hypothetical protein
VWPQGLPGFLRAPTNWAMHINATFIFACMHSNHSSPSLCHAPHSLPYASLVHPNNPPGKGHACPGPIVARPNPRALLGIAATRRRRGPPLNMHMHMHAVGRPRVTRAPGVAPRPPPLAPCTMVPVPAPQLPFASKGNSTAALFLWLDQRGGSEQCKATPRTAGSKALGTADSARGAPNQPADPFLTSVDPTPPAPDREMAQNTLQGPWNFDKTAPPPA